MLKGQKTRMSDRRNGGEEEPSSGELDELIPRKRGPRDHEEEEDEEDGIQYNLSKQILLPEISEHQKKENEEEKEKQGSFNGNRKKIRSKVKKMLLSPLRQFNKHHEGEKKKATNRRYNNPPFPYDGEDFGGLPSCYLCAPSLPLKTRVAANTAKPETSSYYYFSKSLIEKNDFYSPDCNVHRDIPRSQPK